MILLSKRTFSLLLLFWNVREAIPSFSWVLEEFTVSMTLSNKMHSYEIFACQPLFWIKRSQLCWFGHVSRMSQERLARQVLLVTPMENQLWVRPKTRWSDYISSLTLLGPVFMLGQQNYLRFLLTMRYLSPMATGHDTLPRAKAGMKINIRGSKHDSQDLHEKFYQGVPRLIPDPLASGAVVETCIKACLCSNQNTGVFWNRKSTLGRNLEKSQIGKIRCEPNNCPGCYMAVA